MFPFAEKQIFKITLPTALEFDEQRERFGDIGERTIALRRRLTRLCRLGRRARCAFCRRRCRRQLVVRSLADSFSATADTYRCDEQLTQTLSQRVHKPFVATIDLCCIQRISEINKAKENVEFKPTTIHSTHSNSLLCCMQQQCLITKTD